MNPNDDVGGGRLAAVTGITGFIGGHVAAELIRRGWRLRALARSMPWLPGLAGPPIEIIQGSLADPESLRRLVAGADAIVHLAGAIKGRNSAEFLRANAEGTAGLAVAWRSDAPEARFLKISSMAAREPALSHYAASKRAAEDRLRVVGGDAGWCILRPAAVYGPGDRETLRIFRASDGPVQPMLSAAHARLTVIHVVDLARAVAAMLDAENGWPCCREVTDARCDGYTWLELANAAAAALGRTGRPIQLPTFALRALGAGGDLAALAGLADVLTTQKVREILHPDWSSAVADQPPAPVWRPEIPLEQGFADAVSWYRAAGWLRK